MHSREVDLLRRLIADRPASRRLTATSKVLVELEGVGTIRGAAVYYRSSDFERAANILRTRGFPLEAPKQAFARSDAPAGGSEKTGAQRVSEDMVAVVPIGMPPWEVPDGGFLALPIDAALAMPYSVLLICENMEPLCRLQSYSWLPRFYGGRPVLALFRGAPGFFRTEVAARMLQRDTRPTLAFFDFDPKGLAMAAALPRREHLCLPDARALEAAARHHRRDHLFTNSFTDCYKYLNSVEDPEIIQAWNSLMRIQIGLDQEHFPA